METRVVVQMTANSVEEGPTAQGTMQQEVARYPERPVQGVVS